MIDLHKEALICPVEATNLYPRSASGKKVHVSRIYRDMIRGHRGILLESVRTPRLATSKEAVARFFSRLTQLHNPRATTASHRENSATNKSDPRVELELDRLGF
jgi:hypothetical protein